ncbi:MAG: Ig-like domain-containing protein, partial [Clostridiales bacterium]|nr:Ig-like domain-containing protein [Clostridiales bacterium]
AALTVLPCLSGSKASAIDVTRLPVGKVSTTGSISTASVEKDSDASAIKLNMSKKALVKGDSYMLRIYNTDKDQRIRVSVSDSDIVSVAKESRTEYTVTGESVGSCVITVTIKEGFNTSVATLKCKISVTPAAVTIKFTDQTYYVKVGDKLSLETELKPTTTAEKPDYESSNKDIVTVSNNGVVTGKSAGTAYVYATIANGKSDRCKIVVTE